MSDPQHAADSSSDDSIESVRYQKVRKVTLVGAAVNVVLSAAKIFFGYWGQSQSLIADGLHSLSDLASDFIVLFAAKQGSQDADKEHPYGHARIETAFTVVIGVFLIIVACGIAVDALRRILQPESLMQPNVITLLVAFVSIISKEALYQYTMNVAQHTQSALLKANAWHHRSDAISSIIVLIGIGGTLMGITYLDAIAAIGMGLMIIKIGWVLCLQSIQELIDTGLSQDRIRLIEKTIQAVPGVQHLHTLRTRRMGSDALVDVHIQVAPKLSVSEGHFISESVRRHLLDQVAEVKDVMVHIDPEDDEIHPTNEHLPSRKKLLKQLHKCCASIPAAQYITHINLHYLDGQIHMELLLPLDKLGDQQHARQIAAELVESCRQLESVSEISVLIEAGS